MSGIADATQVPSSIAALAAPCELQGTTKQSPQAAEAAMPSLAQDTAQPMRESSSAQSVATSRSSSDAEPQASAAIPSAMVRAIHAAMHLASQNVDHCWTLLGAQQEPQQENPNELIAALAGTVQLNVQLNKLQAQLSAAHGFPRKISGHTPSNGMNGATCSPSIDSNAQPMAGEPNPFDQIVAAAALAPSPNRSSATISIPQEQPQPPHNAHDGSGSQTETTAQFIDSQAAVELHSIEMTLQDHLLHLQALHEDHRAACAGLARSKAARATGQAATILSEQLRSSTVSQAPPPPPLSLAVSPENFSSRLP